MQRSVIYGLHLARVVLRQPCKALSPWLTNVGAVSILDWVVHSVHFLLVSDEMLYGRDDALVLNPFNRFPASNTLEYRICAKPFPIATTLWFASQRPNGWTQQHVHTLSTSLLAHGSSALIHEILVERGTRGNPIRKYGNVVGFSDAIRGIVEA
jgi:hypothetical protein